MVKVAVKVPVVVVVKEGLTVLNLCGEDEDSAGGDKW